MGNSLRKIKQSESQIIQDISWINKLTNDTIFEKRYKYVDEVLHIPCQSGCTLEPTSILYVSKIMRLSLKKFYEFFSSLRNCLSIFYDEKEIKFEKTPDNEDFLCAICLERKKNIMLLCYHSFCERCLEIWLGDKKGNCPMCRIEVACENEEGLLSLDSKWSFVDYNDINDNNYIQDLDAIFVASFYKFLS